MSLSINIPQFNHPEVSVFYEYDLSIPQEKVADILALPRATLIKDMEMMLEDMIERYEFFYNYTDKDKWWEFPTHALWILVELSAEESIPTIQKVLSQNGDFIEFWFGDFSTEDFWEVVYHLGRNSLPILRRICLYPDASWICRDIPGEALVQVVLNHPERRTEIIDWFGSVLGEFLAISPSGSGWDSYLVSSLIHNALALQAKELLPVIKLLYEEDLVIEELEGDYQYAVDEIQEPRYPARKRRIFSNITERYEDAMTWHGYKMRYDEEYKAQNTPKPFIQKKSPFDPSISFIHKGGTNYRREGKKIGRNDPCPCGSGRKYKKCCMNK
ncbi:MAG: DUF1186 domain-containing protein [Bacteroidetes bacterium]|nr:DUF1186 domain-containing protein [Bacteroidota bacterium]MCB0841778.1 DUF1186 domain-containing protein [Bacteroidota bacterium]